MMGLITLLLVLAFTALYFSKTLDKKPEPLTKLADAMTAHIDKIAFWGSVYGAAAAVLTLLMHYSLGGMLVRLVNNVLVCAMALPFIFDRLVEKYHGKVNVAIMDEAKIFVGWVTKNEKFLGYAGAGCGVTLFFMLFK